MKYKGSTDSNKQLKAKVNSLNMENARLNCLLEKAEERLKKERFFLFSLIDGIPAYIYLQEKDYSISYANKAFEEFYGNYYNKPCYLAMHNRDKPCETCKTFTVFQTHMPQEWVSYNRNGIIFHIYDYPFIDENGKELVLEMGIDITKQQKYEDIRTSLFANISHELRSPLAKIMGYTEALRDGIYKDQADYHKLINCIYSNSVSLNTLIGDLFELSKLETLQAFHFENINLYNAILDYCQELELYFDGKKQKFFYCIDQDIPVVRVDTNRMIQVLRNLIDNAVRFTGDGDSISIKTFRDGKSLVITVCDTGRGIAPEDIKYIFTRFYQGTRKFSSGNHSGLGLYICKTIIKQHEGRIWVENGDSEDSEGSEGSVFYIRLPESDGSQQTSSENT